MLKTKSGWKRYALLSQIKQTHYRAAEAAKVIESAERELNRILVTFDSPVENQRIRGKEVLIRGRAKASAGIRSVTVTVNGEIVHPIFLIERGGEAPDSLELNQAIMLGEGRSVLILEAEDTLGRRETLRARTVNVVLPFYRRPLPLNCHDPIAASLLLWRLFCHQVSSRSVDAKEYGGARALRVAPAEPGVYLCESSTPRSPFILHPEAGLLFSFCEARDVFCEMLASPLRDPRLNQVNHVAGLELVDLRVQKTGPVGKATDIR